MVTVKHIRQMSCNDHGRQCRINTPLGWDDGMTRKQQRVALNRRFRKAGKRELEKDGGRSQG